MGKFINGLGACRKSAHFQYSGHLSGPRFKSGIGVLYKKLQYLFLKK